MSTIYSIYKATNLLNGKCYIGFDSKWPKRKNAHLNDAFNPNFPSYNYHFHRAIRKYGKENFSWEIVYQSKEQLHTLNVMEPFFIKEWNSKENGYNLTNGGEGTFGYIPLHMIGKNNPMCKLRTNKGSFNKGIKLGPNSETTKIKKSLSKIGSRNPNFGKPETADSMNKKGICFICGVESNLGNLKRWHNENCRKRN